MKLTLKIWRQKNAQDKGKMVDYQIDGIEPDMSFLEMLDVFNEDLINKGGDPVARHGAQRPVFRSGSGETGWLGG